jgi:hypothetical protein
MSEHKKREPKARKRTYQPTEPERIVLDQHVARKAAKTPAPRMKVLYSGRSPTVSVDHSDLAVGCTLLAKALGSADADFTKGLLEQLVGANSHDGQIDEDGLNFLLSIVKGVEPRDELEAMLAAQIATIHVAIMTFGRRLAHVETIQQQDSAERALNKLARTYAAQMEALKRYRTGGEQKVTVQHVSVSEGGQAIVGNVTQATPRTAPEKPATSPHALSDARKPAMTIVGNPERAPAVWRRRKIDGGQSRA